MGRAKKQLEKILGTNVNFFAYPKGNHSERIVKYVRKAGYKAAFTMDHQEIKPRSNFYLIPRTGINRTHSPKEVLHAVSPSSIVFRRLISKFVKKTW